MLTDLQRRRRRFRMLAQNALRAAASPGAPIIIIITDVTIFDTGDGIIEVAFSAPVTAADFNPNLFTDVTAGHPADAVEQADTNILHYSALLWQGAVHAGDAWIYSDHVTNIVTPQNGTAG